MNDLYKPVPLIIKLKKTKTLKTRLFSDGTQDNGFYTKPDFKNLSNPYLHVSVNINTTLFSSMWSDNFPSITFLGGKGGTAFANLIIC